MAEDSQSIAPEEPGEDLGQQLVQRAAAPGVIRRDLAARIQRSCCVAETGLATEIQRRFAPASSAPWGQGPALPYGFGGSGGTASGGLPPGLPTIQAKPASSSSSSSSPAAPVARTVGAPAAPVAGAAAAEVLSPLGSSLQRRHLGATQSGTEMVQRRSLPGSPSAPAAISIPTPISPSIPTSISTPIQRSSPASPADPAGIVEGPAIVRRSVGSHAAAEMPLRRMSEPEEEKPAAQSPAPPLVQASPARTEMGPAIVHRSAGRAPVQRVSTAPASAAPVQAPSSTAPAQPPVSAAPAQAPVQRAASPSSPVSPISPRAGNGVGLPLAQPVRLQPVISPTTSAAGVPVQRTAAPGAPSPAPHLPLVQAASGRGDTGGGIVQRAAAQALPLARQAQPAGAAGSGSTGGGAVQRQTEGGSSQSAPAAGTFGGTDSEASAPAAATGGTAATGALDLDDVVEQVMRRLKRSLAVESERHGGRR